MPTQLSIAFAADRSMEDRFRTWCLENPHIVRRIAEMALDLRRAGRRHYGIKALFEVVRYETALREADTRLKLNNDYTARLARKLMREHPELDGFFEIRELTAH